MTEYLKYPLYKNHLPNGQVIQGLLVINRLKKKTEEQNYQDISWDKGSKGIQDNPGTKIKPKGKKGFLSMVLITPGNSLSWTTNNYTITQEHVIRKILALSMN